MIWFDCTKAAKTGHHSGLQRVSVRLRTVLGQAATPAMGLDWVDEARRDDWFLTAEVFAPHERPGWDAVLAQRPCRLAAVFHDAIPMKHPQITWPQSVARHPAYLKMLAGFDLVLAVSEASRRDLIGYWSWLGLERTPRVELIALGADFDASSRGANPGGESAPLLLCVGIIEPRKNQSLLLEVCASLWNEGHQFELHLVGRVNPIFGRRVVRRIRQMQRQWPGLHYHASLDDAGLARLYSRARVALFPTIAEGCGLPVVESMWRGVPCLCSDIPPIRENAEDGGAALLPVNDAAAWKRAILGCVQGDADYLRLVEKATTRALPTWQGTAAKIRALLQD
ncbi:MAG: glycosyltransferase [Opitutaceae bacterium]